MHLCFIFLLSLLIMYLSVSLPKHWTKFLLDAGPRMVSFTKTNQKSGNKEEIMFSEDTHTHMKKTFLSC